MAFCGYFTTGRLREDLIGYLAGFGDGYSFWIGSQPQASITDGADYGLRLTGCQEIGSDHVMFIFERVAVMFGRL